MLLLSFFMHNLQSHTERPTAPAHTHLLRKNKENGETGRAGVRKWFNILKYPFMFCMWEYSVFSWVWIYFQYKDKSTIIGYLSKESEAWRESIPISGWCRNQTWINLIYEAQVLSSKFCCFQESTVPKTISFGILIVFLFSKKVEKKKECMYERNLFRHPNSTWQVSIWPGKGYCSPPPLQYFLLSAHTGVTLAAC